jgi:hypothetical protein
VSVSLHCVRECFKLRFGFRTETDGFEMQVWNVLCFGWQIVDAEIMSIYFTCRPKNCHIIEALSFDMSKHRDAGNINQAKSGSSTYMMFCGRAQLRTRPLCGLRNCIRHNPSTVQAGACNRCIYHRHLPDPPASQIRERLIQPNLHRERDLGESMQQEE